MRYMISFMLLLLVQSAFAVAPSKPNIVVLFIDDLGYADIGPFGATKQKTPNLDKMAAEGMKLTSFYAAPVCSVSRAQLLTGCYGARVSVPAVFFPGGPQGLNPKEVTIPEYLKQQGYATQCIGKWHVGDQPAFMPTKQGFDHYYGIPYSNDMQRVAKATGQRVVPLMRGEKVEELLTDEMQSTIVEKYTAEALRFIRTNKDKPFFLYMPHNAVHTPIHAGERFRGKSANGRFGDWVEEVDWSVGEVFRTLKEHKLQENTLVLFTSDNGPWLIKGADGGSAKPLYGGKGSTWEGGVRVPTIAWWPGKIRANSTSDAISGTIDLLPTFVKLAGGEVPAEPVIDGRDLAPVLFNGAKQTSREAHYYFSGYNLQAVRKGPWKLALVPQNDSLGGKGPSENSTKNPRLFNLDNDIGESKNIADQHPKIVEELKALASKMAAEIAGQNPTARRPAGVVSNPVTLYPTDEPVKPKAKGKDNSKPGELKNLKSGDTLGGNAAPQIANKPFTLSCEVETELKDTVIVAHGGLMVGYALQINGGRVIFSVRTSRDSIIDVQSEPISGQVKINASIAADGTMTLNVGNQKPVSAKSPGLISRQPQEEFCVGFDSMQPEANYAGLKRFAGKIAELKVTTP